MKGILLAVGATAFMAMIVAMRNGGDSSGLLYILAIPTFLCMSFGFVSLKEQIAESDSCLMRIIYLAVIVWIIFLLLALFGALLGSCGIF